MVVSGGLPDYAGHLIAGPKARVIGGRYGGYRLDSFVYYRHSRNRSRRLSGSKPSCGGCHRHDQHSS